MPAIRTASRKWPTFARVLLFCVICPLFLVFAGPLTTKLRGHPAQLAVGLLTSFSTLALTWLFVRWDRINLEDVGAALGRKSTQRLLAGIAIGLFLVALHTLLFTLCTPVHWKAASWVGMPSIWIALLAYLALACREELAFRGYPLRRLESSLGFWTAQLIVAFLFALEHIAGGVSAVHAFQGAFVGSLLFSMAALATRGLALPIGMHAAWNFGQWALGEKELPGIWTPVIEENSKARLDLVQTLSYLLVFIAATVAFWFWRRSGTSDVREDSA